MITERDILDRCEPEPMSGCWIWTGTRKDNGYGLIYGVVRSSRLKQHYAHRAAHEVYKGPIPAGLDIDHLCRNTLCVNPSHLEAVTRRVNVLRGHTVAAFHAAKTHCQSGHAFDEANTYRYKDGSRSCRACGRVRAAQKRLGRVA